MDPLNGIRAGVLARVDRAQRNFRLAFIAGACIELAFLGGFLLLADMHNRLHVLLLISTVATYSIVILGLFALGAHVTRAVLRVLQALEERG
ncbi:MAG TPA: hypothetical protein VI670_09080 [Thermoanaerobaculia bacterium]|jgi:hypothetical protein